MTCEVCDLAAIRAAHAYAIEWHTFKGETKEVIDAVPSLLDALVAARAREAALTAEVERLRDQLAEATNLDTRDAEVMEATRARRQAEAEVARLRTLLTKVEAERDAKQRGYVDLHEQLDPVVGRADAWSQVDTLIKRAAKAEAERKSVIDRVTALRDAWARGTDRSLRFVVSDIDTALKEEP